MSEQFNMTIDVDWNAAKEERAGQLPPEVGEQILEITKVMGGVQKQGENEGAPYVNLLCTQRSGELQGTRSCFKFIGFGTKTGKRGTTQVGEAKAFIVDIGRSDVFDYESFNAADLIGTLFTANVTHSEYNGKTSVWLNNPKPYVVEQGAPEEVDETPEPPRPKPVQFAESVVNSAVAAKALANTQIAEQAPVAEPAPAQPRRVRPSAR